jgi:hypothetical protein
MIRRAALALLVLSSCGDDTTAVESGCKRDSDCPRPEMKCVPAAAVCVGFSTPLDLSDAGPPDAE